MTARYIWNPVKLSSDRFDSEGVVCREDARWKFLGQFVVAWELVRKVGEPRMCGIDTSCYLQCTFKGEM